MIACMVTQQTETHTRYDVGHNEKTNKARNINDDGMFW